MKPTLVVLSVATQLATMVLPASQGQAATAPEASSIRKLDLRLRQSSFARLRVGDQWRWVHSPRATAEGIRVAGSAQPESLGAAAGIFPWEEVEAVEMRVTGAGRGALIGALVLAAAAGAAAGAISSDIGINPTYEVDPGAVIGGAAVGALVGGLLGAVVGTGFKRWVRVYP